MKMSEHTSKQPADKGKKGGNTDLDKPLATATTNGRSHSQVDVVVQNWIVNLFFDGTGNNYYNTDTRKKGGPIPPKDNASYLNDYSNVAHLFHSRPESIKGFSWIYIQGIGTTRDLPDTQQGMGLGSGRTGIERRVELAFAQIVNDIRRRAGKDYIPAILTLNVFGFSRGAAAARHFVNTAKTNPKLFKGWNLNKNRVIVRFVGLFDTVSSYEKYKGEEGSVLVLAVKNARMPNFENDTGELQLKFGKGHAQKVFHLTADDEYRENFSLTTIKSAIDQGCGLEIKLTGAHSDIGGGYAFKENEFFTAHTKKLENWFSSKGYFEGKDGYGRNKTNPSRTYQAEDGEHTTPAVYSSTGRFIDYHKVPFKAMYLVSQKAAKGLLPFDTAAINRVTRTNQPMIQSLLDSKGALLARIMKEASQEKWQAYVDLAFKDNNTTKKIRSLYIHWSAKHAIGLGVRMKNEQSKNDDEAVRLKNGLPYREIYPG